MAASGSGGDRPWSATSTWAPGLGGGAVEDAVSFETSDYDAEATPAGIVLSRPLPDGDGDVPPCEITVSFRGKYEIHRVYVRSTARIYELYHSTDAKENSKDYLCTVRCGIAVKEPDPCGEESMSQWSGGARTNDKVEHEIKSVSGSSDEESWVDVKFPESPMENNMPEAQERKAIRICQENNLAHYEATAEMTDVSPCVSLTVRLLSIQSKTSVHIDEIYIFADPVESTNDNSVTGPGNIGGSSLLAMLVPGLMQMSTSRNLKIDDRYFSDGSRTQLTQDRAMKESSTSEKIVQERGPSSADNYKPTRIESGINPADSGTVSNKKTNQGEFQLKDLNSLPLPVQATESTQATSVKDQQKSDTDHLGNPSVNEKFTPYNHIERKLDTLLSKVEKMELYWSRFADSMIKPLGSIEARLQRLEDQFTSFSVEIQSSRGCSAVSSAPDSMSNMNNSQEEACDAANDRTPAPITDKPGLAVRAPDFSSDDSSCYNVTNENQANFRGPNAVPRLLVKVPEFIAQPDIPGGNLRDGPSSPVYCAPSSEKVRKISPGLVVKVPEFPDDDDEDEVEEEKAQVGDHDDDHAQYDDTLSKSTVESTKSKKSVSINGALASALEALLTSTKGTSSSRPVVCTASNLSAENTNDSFGCSLSPEKIGKMCTKDCSADQFLGTSCDANLVGTIRSSQEIDSIPHTSLSKEMLDNKVEINEQNDDFIPEKVPFVASTESVDVPSQPDTVEESIDNGSQVNEQKSCPSLDTLPYATSTGPLEPPNPPSVFEVVDSGVQVNENRPIISLAEFLATTTGPLEPPKPPSVFEVVDSGVQVNENRPIISLAEFLAARNSSSGKNVNPEVCSSNDGSEKLSCERILAGADKNSKNISQLLVKKALEVDADEGKHVSSVPIGATFDGSSSADPGNAASGHNIITKEAVSDKCYGLKNAGNDFRLSVGMDSIFSQYHTTDCKKEWIENSSSDWRPDDSFSKPSVMCSWSNLSSMESFNRVPAKETVVSANATSGNYVEDLEDIGDYPTSSKDSLSLEVLLAESYSEAQISHLEDINDGTGIGSAQLFSTFSSSDDNASAAEGPLVNIADLATPSGPYASAVKEPLVDVADLTNPSETDASSVNEPLADMVDLPNPSATYASDVNDGPFINVDDLPEPLETFSGGSSEHPNSLI